MRIFSNVRNDSIKGSSAGPVLKELMALKSDFITRANILSKDNFYCNLHGVWC